MRLKNIILTLTIGASLTSCGFLDVEPQVICADTFYNTQTEALSGLVGVYGVMNNREFYGEYYSLEWANLDDLCYYNRPTTTEYIWHQSCASVPPAPGWKATMAVELSYSPHMSTSMRLCSASSLMAASSD